MSDYGPTPTPAVAQPLVRHIHGGETIDFTPDSGTDYGAGVGAGVAFGAVVVNGSQVAVALRDIPAGVQGSLSIDGCKEFPKAANDGGMAAGSFAYWDANAQVATGTSSGNTYIGKVESPGALTADTTVRITLKDANASGSVGFGKLPVASVTAAGSSVSDAAALSGGFNLVGSADGTKGVVLPSTPTAGTVVEVKNNASSGLKVYPDAAATINAISSHAAITMAANTCCRFIATSATQWYTDPLVPS